jgi:hypothetical protein
MTFCTLKKKGCDAASPRLASFDLTKLNQASVKWGWYQEGYDVEPTDKNCVEHTSYIGHHNGRSILDTSPLTRRSASTSMA